MHPKCAGCNYTLYPIGTATIVTIDIYADISFVMLQRDTNEQGYCKNEMANINLNNSKGCGLPLSEQTKGMVRTRVADL